MSNSPYIKALSLMRKGSPPDKAYPFLVEAMNAGDYRAHYAIGTWHLYGRHVKKDFKKAVKLLKHAADNGIAEAAFDLAVCYEKGEGVLKNPSKAAAYYLRALRYGDQAAADELYRIFYWGLGVDRNRLLAKQFDGFQLPVTQPSKRS